MQLLTVLYPEPADRVEFERYYREVHLPLCAKLPGLREIRFSIGISKPGASIGEEPYFAMFQARFDDAASLRAAMKSSEGEAVEADVPNYASGGAKVIVSRGESFDL